MHDLPASHPLADEDLRNAQRETIIRLQKSGALTYEHLPYATEAARAAGRGRKSSADTEKQRNIARRVAANFQLPPGAKRADGRDADRAREYQRKYRKKHD